MKSKEEIVKNMVDYIEAKERDLQASKLLGSTAVKASVVDSIIKQLEKEIADED